MGLARTGLTLGAVAVVVLVWSGAGCVSSDVDPCPDYCAKVAAKCGTAPDTTQYIDEGACRAMCTAIADNAKKGAGSDTIECRVGKLSLVDEAPDTGTDTRAVRCLEAGPYSASCAGSACTAWCRIVQSTCTGNNSQYPDQAACEAACNAFPPGSAANIPSTKTGNTLTCRFYHLEAASMPNGASNHCPHLAPLGKVTPCQ